MFLFEHRTDTVGFLMKESGIHRRREWIGKSQCHYTKYQYISPYERRYQDRGQRRQFLASSDPIHFAHLKPPRAAFEERTVRLTARSTCNPLYPRCLPTDETAVLHLEYDDTGIKGTTGGNWHKPLLFQECSCLAAVTHRQIRGTLGSAPEVGPRGCRSYKHPPPDHSVIHHDTVELQRI